MSSLVGKMVTYNGGTESFYSSSSPSSLARGKQYLVISERVMGFQTNLYLEGIKGEFNSVWFDEVKSEKKEWLALATLCNKPDTFLGKRIMLKRLHEGGEGYFETVNTSTILSVKKVYGSVYIFETKNSVYVTRVNLRTGC